MSDHGGGRQRVYRPTLRERWSCARSGVQIGTTLVLLAAVLLSGLVLYTRHTNGAGRDYAGLPLRRGQADVFLVGGQRNGPGPVELEFDSGNFWASSGQPLYVGQRVEVRYRIGRSGRVYIFSVLPR